MAAFRRNLKTHIKLNTLSNWFK